MFASRKKMPLRSIKKPMKHAIVFFSRGDVLFNETDECKIIFLLRLFVTSILFLHILRWLFLDIEAYFRSLYIMNTPFVVLTNLPDEFNSQLVEMFLANTFEVIHVKLGNNIEWKIEFKKANIANDHSEAFI